MKLTGLIAAPHTPSNADYSLNTEAVPKQAWHLANTGVKGVFVGGTTGECHSYSTTERIELFKEWGEAARANDLVNIAHVGHNNLPDAQALVEAAQASGADAIGAMAPNFFKPGTTDELINWFVLLTEVAPELPFYFYDIPGMTGVSLDTAEFLRKGRDRLPSLVGVKFTNPDQELLADCMQVEDGSFDVLFGTDEKLTEGLEMGCLGAVGSSYNFAANIYHPILEAHRRGDLETAKLWQKRSIRTIDVIASHGYLPAAKMVMKMIGVDCGPARPPLTNLKGPAASALEKELENMGFFDWIK
ncbi:MAG: N-acetylneuraminate lyase [Opitutales bacterium]|jgi:N-acetylneuraminate lyase|nr:N-acetylneuraminate lyase [Opitutales bacterium]